MGLDDLEKYKEEGETFGLKDIIDEKETFDLKEEFEEFIGDHIKELSEKDNIIALKRKGNVFFEHLREKFPSLKTLGHLSQNHIHVKKEELDNSKIIIFDDSIDEGNNFGNIMKVFEKLNINPKEVLVLNVIVNENAIEKIKEKYQDGDLKFLYLESVSDEEYGKLYPKCMFGYIDYINESLNKDFSIITLELDKRINIEELKECFNEKFDIMDLEHKLDLESLERNKEHIVSKISLDAEKFFNNKRESFPEIENMKQTKVRIFLRDRETNSSIDIIPILIPENPPVMECKDKEICKLDEFKKKHLENSEPDEECLERYCIKCLQENLSKDFDNKFQSYLIKKLKKKGIQIMRSKTEYPIIPDYFPLLEFPT